MKKKICLSAKANKTDQALKFASYSRKFHDEKNVYFYVKINQRERFTDMDRIHFEQQNVEQYKKAIEIRMNKPTVADLTVKFLGLFINIEFKSITGPNNCVKIHKHDVSGSDCDRCRA